MPITPPRRPDKPGAPDDTVSNMQGDTFKGTPGSGKSGGSSAGQSNVQFGSNVFGQSGPGSSAGKSGGGFGLSGSGSSILGLGSSSIIGKGGSQSGKSSVQGSSKSFPIAKSIDGPKPAGSKSGDSSKSTVQRSAAKSPASPPPGNVAKPPAKPRDETLGNLIDQAVEQVKTTTQTEQMVGNQPIKRYDDSSIPTWIWFALFGGIAGFVAIVMLFWFLFGHS